MTFNDYEMTPKMTLLNDPKKVHNSSSCLLALTELFANKYHGEHNHHGAKIKIFCLLANSFVRASKQLELLCTFGGHSKGSFWG